MPPKAKLHKSSGKSGKPIQATLPSTSSASLSPEVEQQFEIELCWCIQQLQRALSSGKLNEKQVQEKTKVLNILMGNTAPLIKKRQLMRLTFGDYRTKMSEEDKKLSRAVTNIKISQASPSKKSVFVKKAAFTSSNNSFKFNFDVKENTTEESNLADNLSKVEIQEISKSNNTSSLDKFHFNTSDNSFKFNFGVDQS